MTFQGNHAWQEGHSHLNMSLLPVLGLFQLTAAAETVPRKRGNSFLRAGKLSEESDGHLG